MKKVTLKASTRRNRRRRLRNRNATTIIDQDDFLYPPVDSRTCGIPAVKEIYPLDIEESNSDFKKISLSLLSKDNLISKFIKDIYGKMKEVTNVYTKLSSVSSCFKLHKNSEESFLLELIDTVATIMIDLFDKINEVCEHSLQLREYIKNTFDSTAVNTKEDVKTINIFNSDVTSIYRDSADIYNAIMRRRNIIIKMLELKS